MIVRRPTKQLHRARAMRRAPTKAEDILWRSLRGAQIGVKFRRQVPIGSYIADFACLPAKVVVEVDGPPHFNPEQQARDRARDAWLVEHGWRVVRIPNEMVFGGGNLVLDAIKDALPKGPSSDLASQGHLLPRGGRRKRQVELMTMIYKIVPSSLWHAAEQTGIFEGAPIDRADGYIHFSTAEQVRETAAKHFAGQADLLLFAVDPVHLGSAVRWEPSRGGALFPHLYAALAVADVLWVRTIPVREDGAHDFAGLVP